MKSSKKILLQLLVFLFLFSQITSADIVKNIEINGNKRIADSTIIVFGDIKKNASYNEQDLNNIIKNLYDTNFFSKINIDLDNNGNLKIFVVEKPIVNLIQFTGLTAKKFETRILDIINTREKMSFNKSSIKPDLKKIENSLRSIGYYFVKAEAQIQELKDNRVNIIFDINMGDKAKIAKIYFLGDKKIRDKKLRAVITSEESKFWKFLSTTKYLIESRIDLDKRLLKNYYLNKGYYEAQVTSSNAEYIEGKGFVLTFSINAGKKYKFKKVFVNVDDNLEKSPFFPLNKELTKLVGSYYSPKKLRKVLDKIDNLSQQKELQFINHKIVETLEDDKVIVKIDVFEGDKYFVERINIFGNNVTNENVIREEIIVDEGDPYSVLLLNRSINQIKARNIFESVEKKVSMGSARDLYVIDIEVTEKSTGEISAGAGVGTTGGSFAFSIKENNFLGTGVKLNSSLDMTTEAIRLKFATVNPNFRSSGNSLSTNIESTKTDKVKTAGFESTNTGFSVSTSFEQYESFYISLGTSAFYETIDTTSDASTTLKKMDGSYGTFNFNYSLINDKRNQKWQPTAGHVSNFSQRIPLYATSPSLLNSFDVSAYKSFSDEMVGSIKLYSRAINALTDEDVKVTERIFMPSRRLRGFKSGKVGPIDNGDHVGGNYAAALGFNVSLPNILPEELKTDFNLFLDTANVWGVDYNDIIGKSDTIRSSVGVSASIFTPVGPLSFSLAQPLSKAETDEVESFRFSLGTTF